MISDISKILMNCFGLTEGTWPEAKTILSHIGAVAQSGKIALAVSFPELPF